MLSKEKIKVAILLPSLKLGGAEKLVYEELVYLKNDKRFDFQIHVIFEQGELYNEYLDLGYPVYVWNAPHKSIKLILVYWKISRQLKNDNINILHCHLVYKYGPYIGHFANIHNIITTVHTDVNFTWLERFGLSRCNTLLACGNNVKKNLENFISSNRIIVLNNATRAQNNAIQNIGTLENQCNIETDINVILTIGRLISDKGYEYLIDAFNNVLLHHPNTVLLIAGDGPDRDKLDKKITTLGLIGKVRLLGNVSNVYGLYKRANIYVNSSLREGLPMTLLEAMSYGKAIIATNVGGNGELIIDGETGLLVNRLDQDALETAIRQLLGDSNKRKIFSDNARNHFMNNYNIEKHCGLLGDIYMKTHCCRVGFQ